MKKRKITLLYEALKNDMKRCLCTAATLWLLISRV